MLYHFNLTDGDEVILDNKGINVPCISAAETSAMEVIEELRREDPFYSHEWQDWRLEIADPSGRVVKTIPLETQPQVHCC